MNRTDDATTFSHSSVIYTTSVASVCQFKHAGYIHLKKQNKKKIFLQKFHVGWTVEFFDDFISEICLASLNFFALNV